MKPFIQLLILTLCLLMTSPSLKAAFVINPTFDSTFTGYTYAADDEAVINAAISYIESIIANPITVNITFSNETNGLGNSGPQENFISYQKYYNDLKIHQVLSTDDATAIATLPNTVTSPISGITNVYVALPVLRALGETNLGNNYGSSDGGVAINLGLCTTNLATQSGKYSLEWVAIHEIDEILGVGDTGSSLIYGTNSGLIGSLDLFRFGAANTRSFTTNTSATAYFSINNGTNNLAGFYQQPDYGDWSMANDIQSALIPKNQNASYSKADLTALDVIGYTLLAVPEPLPYLLFGLGTLALLMASKKRIKSAG